MALVDASIDDHGGRVGPNAILQTLQAARQLHGPVLERALFNQLGLTHLPEQMVDVGLVNCLNDHVFERLGPERARLVMARAGVLTADYVMENRIPRAVRAVLKHLPARLAQPLLIKAICRNSWTFAGQSHVWFEDGALLIASNPIALGPCVWHESVLTHMLRTLAGPSSLSVQERACVCAGADACRFEITSR